MTSEQRREARYRRRQTRRQAKRKARSDALGPIEEVFSYRAMFFYGRKCCNGVRWKASTQRFEMHLFSGTAKRRRKILNGTWKPGKTAHFTLKERGKVRPIDAPHIEDRQVYKVLTKKVLVPLYVPSMIYDNKASQKGGGLHFHYRRLAKHLRDHYRKHGLEGALFLMDFHHFFPDAPHALLYERHRGMILNPDLRQLADLVVAAVPGGVGMPLGVEPSQQEMVALPSSGQPDQSPAFDPWRCPLHGRLLHHSAVEAGGGGDRGGRDRPRGGHGPAGQRRKVKSGSVLQTVPVLQSKVSGDGHRRREDPRLPGRHEAGTAETAAFPGACGQR